MNRFLLFIVSFFLFVTSYATLIIPNEFDGSALCGDLSVTYYLPDSLKGNYSYSIDVNKVDADQTVYMTYRFFTNPQKGRLVSIKLDMMPYFDYDDEYIPNLYWKVARRVFIDDQLQFDFEYFNANPFSQDACYDIVDACDSVIVERKRLEAICTFNVTTTTFEYRFAEDSLIAFFKDSTIYNEGGCLAEGYHVIYDYGVIKEDIPLSLIDVYFKKKTYLSPCESYCPTNPDFPCVINAPCGPPYRNAFLMEIDHQGCVIDGLSSSESISFISPNVIEDVFLATVDIREVLLRNTLGKKYVVKGDPTFNVSQLPRGVYLASYLYNGVYKTEKIVLK